jgi:hypothetical protein
MALFVHIYFGQEFSEFSTLFESFLIILSTKFGLTADLHEMIKQEPLVGSITFGIYYFIMLMIFGNFAVIIVFNAYKKEVKDLDLKSKMDEQFANPFLFKPFILIRIKEALQWVFKYEIYRLINPEKYQYLMHQNRKNKAHQRSILMSYYHIDFDINFERISNITFKKTTSLGAMARISEVDLRNIINERRIKKIWRFIQ